MQVEGRPVARASDPMDTRKSPHPSWGGDALLPVNTKTVGFSEDLQQKASLEDFFLLDRRVLTHQPASESPEGGVSTEAGPTPRVSDPGLGGT